MFRNYLTIALRNLTRFKLYSAINILGLSVGLACCILIALFIKDELSYDDFHANASSIYRVFVEFSSETPTDGFAGTQAPLAPAMLAEYPEIVSAVRFADRHEELVSYEDKWFWEKGVLLADPSVFDVFTFPLIEGDPRSALAEIHSIVLTERMARKYFGDQDPLGKQVRISDEFPEFFKVSGVLKDIPSNSQLQFDFLMPFANQKGNLGWTQWNYSTYIQLRPGTSAAALETKLPDLVAKYIGTEARQQNILRLQPLTRVHLHSHLRGDLATNRDLSHLYFFAAVALLILSLACVNFVNLMTARSGTRQKEVGLRKTVGANRRQLLIQFLGEAILQSFLAFLASLALVLLLLPVFNQLTGKRMTSGFLADGLFLAGSIGLMFVVGALAGSYPAIVISRFQPVEILRKGLRDSSAGRPSTLRRGLIVAQFAVSAAFLLFTFVMQRQMAYVRHMNLGYDKDHLVVLPAYSRDVRSRIGSFKSAILKSPLLGGATLTSYRPSRPNYHQNVWWDGLAEDDWNSMMDWIPVDEDFIKTLGLRLTSGRDFSRDVPADEKGAYILNEAARRMIGWDDPVGKPFKIIGRGAVIGVIEDFHYQSLHQPIRPLALALYRPAYTHLIVRIRAGDIPQSLRFLRETWSEFFSDVPFEYSFFDEDFARVYRTETHLMATFNYVSGLAILIAFLGLVGLASFTTLRRAKEIGIRRVLGASVQEIALLLTREFFGLVLLGNLVAWPVVWLASHAWLRRFAYRTGLGVEIFAAAGLLTLLVALLAVGYQSIKAATTDPTDTLRTE
jgi:ABC-type antimicrobial peptide transport system permease subunit